jgi:uncharacterized membrane protein YphA (DoxX/SURF4 family)
MTHLGYPRYFIPFIGVMKLLGCIAILIPGYPKIKEWAYAGLFFDLIGATYSSLATDGFMPQIFFMLVPFILGTLSYVYNQKYQEILKDNTTKKTRAMQKVEMEAKAVL